MRSDVLCSTNLLMRKKLPINAPIKNKGLQSVKISTFTPTRAHAYARITGLFAFLLSQVSQHTL